MKPESDFIIKIFSKTFDPINYIPLTIPDDNSEYEYRAEKPG